MCRLTCAFSPRVGTVVAAGPVGPPVLSSLVRALLVVNPKATTTSPRARDVIARALGSELKVDVRETAARAHATELAREAAADGYDVVVALGGDGTVNEVVNGLLADGVRADTPVLAVVPGGSANVFVRALGGPRSPVDATADLLAALRAGRTRQIGLGVADASAPGGGAQRRWFTFCAGLGFDAEVIERVERLRALGRTASPGLYVASAVRHFLVGADRRHPAVTLDVPGERSVGPLALAIVANTDPWTYLGSRPVHPLPRASFETGLDVLAPRGLGAARTLALIPGMLAPPRPEDDRAARRARAPWLRGVERRHDLDEFTLRCARPLALQVDGDLLGPVERVTFTSVPRALRVAF
jgi:diacylglycerol kinase family enzyme